MRRCRTFLVLFVFSWLLSGIAARGETPHLTLGNSTIALTGPWNSTSAITPHASLASFAAEIAILFLVVLVGFAHRSGRGMRRSESPA